MTDWQNGRWVLIDQTENTVQRITALHINRNKSPTAPLLLHFHLLLSLLETKSRPEGTITRFISVQPHTDSHRESNSLFIGSYSVLRQNR